MNPSEKIADPASPGELRSTEAERLAEAFRLFNQVSSELSGAYSQLQVQVAQLTERMALLQDALPAGVVVVDGNGLVVQANPAAGRLLQGNIEGMNWPAVESAQLHESDPPGEYWVMPERERRLAMTVSALDSAGGRIILLHDITEAHRLKTQAERNERLAAMGEMAAQLAHQLRTPLAAALLYAGNLENPDLMEGTRIPLAQKTVGRLRALERLIRDMLLFARGEVLGRETMAVTELVQDVAHTIEPLARQQGVEFLVTDGAGAVEFAGNRKELAGALANLLENALHAVSAHGRVELETQSHSERIDFIIRDNGKGMAPDVVTRVFEPFFTTRSEGTGLGLAIARGVARVHGGGIEVSSQLGQGSEFVFSVARQSALVSG